MILVDTSVWIDYFRGKTVAHTAELTRLIETDSVAVCPVIFTEILSGIAEDVMHREISILLDAYFKLDMEPYEAARKAAEIYRAVRKKGKTIRKHNDCLIAAFAIYHRIPLLHADKDFDVIARCVPLALHTGKSA